MTPPFDRLRRVLDAATPGPWTPCPPRAESISGPASHGKRIAECDPDGHNARAEADARAIAALGTLREPLLALREQLAWSSGDGYPSIEQRLRALAGSPVMDLEAVGAVAAIDALDAAIAEALPEGARRG